jgi:hypothetical protein
VSLVLFGARSSWIISFLAHFSLNLNLSVKIIITKAREGANLLRKSHSHSQESFMFVFKLGVAKMQCCLSMNGLVFDMVLVAVIHR